jgi:hypothetical protein
MKATAGRHNLTTSSIPYFTPRTRYFASLPARALALATSIGLSGSGEVGTFGQPKRRVAWETVIGLFCDGLQSSAERDTTTCSPTLWKQESIDVRILGNSLRLQG